MLLVQVDIDGTLRRVSDMTLALEHQYLPLLKNFDPPQWAMTNLSGGWCKVSYGTISFSPDLFSSDWPACKSTASTDWPPAETIDISVYHTDTTEAAAVLLFAGTGYRTLVDRESVEYGLYAEDIDGPLLDEALGYDGETVALPRAFGEVIHESPVRIADYSGYQCYHLGGITGTRARAIASIWDDGLGRCYMESTLHGFSVGDVITIERTNSPAPVRAVVTEVPDTFTFRCDLPYTADDTGHAYKAGYWRVYVDGKPYSYYAILTTGADAFYLDTAPDGQVTISGTGTGDDLGDVVSWACTRLGLTYDGVGARAALPGIGYWADAQRPTLEFLDELCATMTHLFWIDSTTLRLIDMDEQTATTALSEYEYFPSTYERQTPAAVVRASVRTRAAVTDDTGTHVKEVVSDLAVLSRHKYGEDVSITGFHWKRQRVRDCLRRVMVYNTKQRIYLAMPITSDLPTPGQKIIFTDSSLKAPTQSFLFVRGISYDFAANRVHVEGDGSFGPETLDAVPPGLIVGWAGTTIPEGWSPLGGDALDRFLIGAGGDLEPEDIGGSDAVIGTSSTDGSHAGTTSVYFVATTGDDLGYGLTTTGTATAGGHAHDVLIEHTPAFQNVKLLQSSYGQENLPADSVVFGKSNTAPTGLSAFITNERLLRVADNTDTSDTVAGDEVVAIAGGHAHGYQGQFASGTGYTNLYRYNYHNGHTHTLSGSFSVNLQRAFVRAWTKATAFVPPDACIAMYDSLDIPAGWLLCDGNNGTPDLTDCFLVLSADGTTATTGGNTATLSYSLSSASHDHDGTTIASSYARYSGKHSDSVSHTHTLTGDVDYLPLFFAIVFIQREANT